MNETLKTLEQLLEEEKHWREMLFGIGEGHRSYIGLLLPWMRVHLREKHPGAIVTFRLLGSDTVQANVAAGGRLLSQGLGHCTAGQVAQRKVQLPQEMVEATETNQMRLARIWAERDALNVLGLDLPQSFRAKLLDPAFREKVQGKVLFGYAETAPTSAATTEGAPSPAPAAQPSPEPEPPKEPKPKPLAPAPLAPVQPAALADDPRIAAFRGALVANGVDAALVQEMPAAEVELAWEKLRTSSAKPAAPTKSEQTTAKAKRLKLVQELRALAAAGNPKALDFLNYCAQLAQEGKPLTDELIVSTFDDAALQQRLDNARGSVSGGK